LTFGRKKPYNLFEASANSHPPTPSWAHTTLPKQPLLHKFRRRFYHKYKELPWRNQCGKIPTTWSSASYVNQSQQLGVVPPYVNQHQQLGVVPAYVNQNQQELQAICSHGAAKSIIQLVQYFYNVLISLSCFVRQLSLLIHSNLDELNG
ncbi:hypothetical protein KI387_003670, partial [Taxus chinensis]